MRFRRKAKFSVTGVSFPVIGGGVTWADKVDEREVRARTERADAFAEVWRIAQSAHVRVRNNFDNVDELTDIHRRLNILLIEKAPALNRADVDLAQNFLMALDEFIRILRPMSGPSADRVRAEMASTMEPLLSSDDMNNLREAYARVSSYDEMLAHRYREVVFGESA